MGLDGLDSVDPASAPDAAGPVRLPSTWALLAASPRQLGQLLLTSLAIGLALEAALAVLLGPVVPADVRAARWNVVALVYGAGGAGIAQWFVRWLVAVWVGAWAMSRIARTAVSRVAGPGLWAGAAPPALSRRLGVLLAVLVVLLAVVLLPWSALLALGLPWWLAGVPVAWPAARLALTPQAAVLTPATARQSLAASWRRTRRRELFVAWWLAVACAPLAVLAAVSLGAAVYLPAWFGAAWWSASAAAWLYLPFAAALGVRVWWRLGSRYARLNRYP
jgi:hypothetical protein